MTEPTDFDAVVIGSGVSGGWAAKELSERGLKVLLVERGRHIEPGTDYVTEHKSPWEMPYRGFGNQRVTARNYSRPVSEYLQHLFVKDRDAPFVSEPQPFHWLRSHMLGGRSITWGRQVYRLSDLDFAANKLEGNGLDWPIRYADLQPWYDHVERFIGVSGRTEGLPQLPDGKFLPPMAMNCVEEDFRDRVGERFGGRRITIGRVAVLTQDHGGRAACHYCGPCARGCSTGSYFSSQSSTLPAAYATGNLTVVTDRVVHSLVTDASGQRITGVRSVAAGGGDAQTHRGRIVFLCASALSSTHILLNSASATAPAGLGNSSGTLGAYLMDHVRLPDAVGYSSGFTDRIDIGNRPNGFYIPRFRNLERGTNDFVRGYGIQGEARRQDWQRGIDEAGIGAALKTKLRTPGRWRMELTPSLECLPYKTNRVSLDPARRDRWGMPLLRVDFRFRQNELTMARDAAAQCRAMLEAAGFDEVTASAEPMPAGTAIHEMGTARMGNDASQSVLNGFNQSHDIGNLFVTDGACMTSSACQNPSLTYMALTARASAYAVDRLKLGAI